MATGLVWGTLAVAGDDAQAVRAAPFYGRWDWRIGPASLPAIALGALVVARGTTVAARLRWRLLMVLTAVTATAWTTALAASDGWTRLTAPIKSRHEYEPFAAGITEVGPFLRSFVDRLPGYPTHVRGHPPGAPLLFWALDRAGLDGAGWAAGLVLLAWGTAVVAVLVALRAVAGEDAARRAVPFVAVLPAAVWAGTSADALFAAVSAVGTSLVVVAATATARRPAVVALLGGVILGLAAHVSYGATPLLLIPAVIIVQRRAWPVLRWTVAGAVLVVLAFIAAGFWWLDGLEATRREYWKGVASARSWAYFLVVGNPAALLVATGPAWVAGVASLRRGGLRRWTPVLAALAAVVLADASGLSKGEVERIWLPFVPWLALAAGAVADRLRRPLLAAQVALAIVLQAALVSPW